MNGENLLRFAAIARQAAGFPEGSESARKSRVPERSGLRWHADNDYFVKWVPMIVIAILEERKRTPGARPVGPSAPIEANSRQAERLVIC